MVWFDLIQSVAKILTTNLRVSGEICGEKAIQFEGKKKD